MPIATDDSQIELPGSAHMRQILASDLRHSEKNVLLAIMSYGPEVSYTSLVHYTGTSLQTVRTGVLELVALGVLNREEKSSRRDPHRYTVDLTKLPATNA